MKSCGSGRMDEAYEVLFGSSGFKRSAASFLVVSICVSLCVFMFMCVAACLWGSPRQAKHIKVSVDISTDA